MPSRAARMVQRDRSALSLKVLHVEITEESYEFLKEVSQAAAMPMGGLIDVMLKKRKAKLIQSNEKLVVGGQQKD